MEYNLSKAKTQLNLAFLLIDVADSILIDGLSVMRKKGGDLKKDEKRKWNLMLDQVKMARTAMRSSSSVIYNIGSVDMALEGSDNLYDLIWLITDRVGDDLETYKSIRDMIEKLPSKLNYYGGK